MTKGSSGGIQHPSRMNLTCYRPCGPNFGNHCTAHFPILYNSYCTERNNKGRGTDNGFQSQTMKGEPENKLHLMGNIFLLQDLRVASVLRVIWAGLELLVFLEPLVILDLLVSLDPREHKVRILFIFDPFSCFSAVS